MLFKWVWEELDEKIIISCLINDLNKNVRDYSKFVILMRIVSGG